MEWAGHRSAEFSACGKHRLRLDRWWGDEPRAAGGAEINRIRAPISSECLLTDISSPDTTSHQQRSTQMATTPITIREVGSYAITWDGGELFCNGSRTSMALLPKPLANGAVALVDTHCNGANGKQDKVSLSPAQLAMIVSAGRARAEVAQAEYARTHAAEIIAADARETKARAYDRGMNEGSEGYNPYRDAAELSHPDEPQV